MSHFPKPFFKKSRGLWYVEIDRKQINLGSDRDEAQRRYHQLMLQPRQKPVAPTSLAAIVDSFLEWVEKHRSPETYEWYRYRLQRFCERYPDLRMSDLRPFHVQEWADSYDLSRTSKRNYIRTVKRCLKWADQQGYVDANPIEHLEVPGADRREGILTLADYDRLLTHIRSEALRDLVVTTWITGCRPQESLRVEARHVDVGRQRWVFPKNESKGKRNPRVVYLTGEAWEIVSRRIQQFPTGRLFRNTEGKPWTTDAVNCALERVRVRIYQASENFSAELLETEIATQLPQLKRTRIVNGQSIERPAEELRGEARRKVLARLASQAMPRFSLYTLRHSWATRALQSGLDGLTVAILMGHSDPSTLARVYQHLSHHPEHLLEQARRATGT
jgi:integrase